MIKQQPRGQLRFIGAGIWEDEDKDVVINSDLATNGIFVSIDRDEVRRYERELSDDDKINLRALSSMRPFRCTSANAMLFLNDFGIRSNRLFMESGGLSEATADAFDKLTAAWNSDPTFQHYVFLREEKRKAGRKNKNR
jgi:hypothetical protein